MLPDNNPIIVRIEFVLPPSIPGGDGTGEAPALPPEIQNVADKVQVAKDAPLNEGKGNSRTYPILDPIRLTIPKDVKEGKKIVEKLLELLPVKLHQIVQQMIPRKNQERIELPVDQSRSSPVSKTSAISKGEAPTSDQKNVAEEVEGISRSQTEMRLESRQRAIPTNSVNEIREVPIFKGKEKIAEREFLPRVEGEPRESKRDVPLPQEKSTEESKQPLHSSDKGKINREDHSKPLYQREQVANAPIFDKWMLHTPPFPQPLVIPPRTENRPDEHPHKHVEAVARIEGIQPVQRDPPFKPDRNEPNMGVVQVHQDDRDIVRIPLNPDLPLTRQNLFKQAHRGGNRWQEDEGFAIGDLIHMLLCAFICGAKTPAEAWRYLEQRSSIFQKWLHLKKGIPSYRLFAFLFARLSPSAMEKLLLAVTGQGDRLHHLQRMRIWETDRGILCAQSDKEAIKSAPKEVLSLFDIEGSVVHLDLPKLDPALIGMVRKHQGHYLHRIKEKDQPICQQLLDGFSSRVDLREVREMTGSTELREITLQLAAEIEDSALYRDLCSAVKFNSEMLTPSKHWIESRLYLTDLEYSPEQFSHTLRMLQVPAWVEWMLDLDFTDWSCNHTARHCAYLERFAFSLLEKQGRPLESRKEALKDVRVLAQIVKGF